MVGISANSVSAIEQFQLSFSGKCYLYFKSYFLTVSLIFLLGCNSELKELRFDYNAFPDLINVHGKIICVFYNGWEHGSFPEKDKLMSYGGSVYSSVSNDDGLTWSAPQQIIDTPLDDRDPSLTFFDEKLVCSFFQIRADESNLEFNTIVSESFDAGYTWSLPRIIATNLATTSPLLITDTNKIILPGYNHIEKLHAECYILESADGGLNWSSPRLVLNNSRISLSEPAIVKYRNRLILIARSDDDRLNMQSIESIDNGENWINVKDLGFPGQSPYLYNIGDSILLLAQRNPLTSIRISKGKSIQFSKPYVIDYDHGAYGAYPSITNVQGNKLLISYYVETVESQRAEIRFKYLTIGNEEVEISEVISKIFIEPLKLNN